MMVRERNEDGFTLVELIITILLTALITGAMSTALMTALDGSQSTNQRVRESNDAQLIATYLTRDAQAAGGTDPSTGAQDTTLGVSLNDDAGCTNATGTLTVRFKWNDWTSLTSSVARVATYWYDSSTDEVIRTTCTGGAPSDSIALGQHVASIVASCVPATDCPGMPDSVDLAISETNSPKSSTTPYTYSLSASLRPQAENASSSNSTFAPVFALGGAASCPPNGSASGVDAEGSVTVRVYGNVYDNATNLSGCPSIYDQAGYTAGGTAIVSGGSCTGSCPTTTSYPSALPDPFASLTPPSYTCTSGGNPSPVAGHYHAGTYNQPLSLSSATVVFDAGVYVFCKGVTFTSATVTADNVLFYIVTGALSASGNGSIAVSPGTGYDGLAIWQAKTDSSTLSIQGGTSINWTGTVYAPSAEVDFWGTATTHVHAVVARTVSFQGNHTVTVGDPPAVALNITTGSIPSGKKGVAYPSTTISATGGSGIYTWSATGLPSGLSINASTGVISGTATASGSFAPQVTVTDSLGDTDTQGYTLTISGPSISAPGSLPSWTVNRVYPSTTVSATGGTGAITWSATNLPNGLSINPGTGVVSGTPTATGAFSPIVTATDSTGANDSRTYSLTINPAPSITTGSLPGATQGVAYSTTVNGAGGTTAYTWSATGLPAGLAINAGTGVISGTSNTAGTSTVNITLTDAAGATASKSLNLTVTAVPPTVTNVTLGDANGQVKAGDTITVTFSKALAVNTICGGWAGNGADQLLNANNDVVVHLNDNAGATGNDTVTVTSTACPTLHFGTLDLGSPNFVNSTRTYSGSGGNKSSVAYTAASFQLTVTLGGGSAGTAGVAAQTISYTPSTSVTDTFGNAISGSYSFAGRRF